MSDSTASAADKATVRREFGANAAAYVNGASFARGASLARLVELTQPAADWIALDLAAAAGHAALAFAPYVAHVVATDLTPEMLPLARGLAAERGVANLSFAGADVDDLPFSDGRFDLVTCRIAPHHFPDIGRFLAEARRVLRPGGLLAIVDNIVPGTRLRGKKAALVREAGDYINALEKLRDPGHHRCLSLEEWTDAIAAAGLRLEHQETLDKRMAFEQWAARHDARRRMQLRVMVMQAPAAAAAFLQPATAGDLTTFRLQEGLFVARKQAASRRPAR